MKKITQIIIKKQLDSLSKTKPNAKKQKKKKLPNFLFFEINFDLSGFDFFNRN